MPIYKWDEGRPLRFGINYKIDDPSVSLIEVALKFPIIPLPIDIHYDFDSGHNMLSKSFLNLQLYFRIRGNKRKPPMSSNWLQKLRYKIIVDGRFSKQYFGNRRYLYGR